MFLRVSLNDFPLNISKILYKVKTKYEKMRKILHLKAMSEIKQIFKARLNIIVILFG